MTSRSEASRLQAEATELRRDRDAARGELATILAERDAAVSMGTQLERECDALRERIARLAAALTDAADWLQTTSVIVPMSHPLHAPARAAYGRARARAALASPGAALAEHDAKVRAESTLRRLQVRLRKLLADRRALAGVLETTLWLADTRAFGLDGVDTCDAARRILRLHGPRRRTR